MKTYTETSPGLFDDGTGISIPSDPNNRDRANMLQEIEAGEAEIIPYHTSVWVTALAPSNQPIPMTLSRSYRK